MLIRTGPGKYYVTISRPDEFACNFYNFDIDGAELKKDHKAVLFSRVYSILEGGGSAAILGLASVTGSAEHDLELSYRRAQEVEKYLRQMWMFYGSNIFYSGSMKLRTPRGVGKSIAQAFAQKGAPAEDPRWRAVWVHAWDKSSPPPDEVVTPGIMLPDLPLTNDQIEFGNWLDVISWIEGLSPIADMLPGLDLAINIFDTLNALPAAWAAGDQGAYLNGYILGYDNAMQDMADAFKNPSLDRTPLASWPAIPVPQVHKALWTATPNAFQDKGHAGEEAGCKAAYDAMMRLEKKPFYEDVTVRGAVTQQSFTGKQVLRALSKKFRDNVAVYFVKKFNELLAKKGMRPWPTVPL